MSRILGIATIGQAPRDDIAALFAAHAPAGTRVVLRGCLDDVLDAEIERRKPQNGADTLYTRLRGDCDVKISKHLVIEQAPRTLEALRRDGCDTIVFACTGDFPPMPGDAGVLFPSRVLSGLVHALLPRGRLGILIPLPEQADRLAAKWARDGVEVVAEALVPSAGAGDAVNAARRLKSRKPDLVAMDCMSYTPAMKEIVKREFDIPTLLAISATGRVLREMLE